MDESADVDGWRHSDAERAFHLRHDDFRVAHLDGMDYDVGMVRVREARAMGERAMRDTLANWGVALASFDYLWNTDCP